MYREEHSGRLPASVRFAVALDNAHFITHESCDFLVQVSDGFPERHCHIDPFYCYAR